MYIRSLYVYIYIHRTLVGLWDILCFPLLGLRGSYLLVFFKGFKSPTYFSVVSRTPKPSGSRVRFQGLGS